MIGGWALVENKAITSGALGSYDSSVKLCSHFDGPDGATAYTDPLAGAATFAGTAQLDTAAAKFGNASLLLDGNSDYISYGDSTSWAFGNSDITIDFWVKWGALPGSGGVQMFYSQFVDVSNCFEIYLYNDSGAHYEWHISGGTLGSCVINVTGTALDTTNWFHFAFVRSSGTWRVYENGVVASSTGTWDSTTIPDLNAALFIGNRNGGAYYVNGWIDEYRISNTARWTAAFAPLTEPYGPLSAGAHDSFTKLCSHFDGTDAATAYTDPIAGAATFVGTAQLDTAQMKFGTASLLLDGNSDYITFGDSDNWNFGTGAFTLECWVRFNHIPGDGGAPGQETFMAQYVDDNNFWSFGVYTTAGTYRLFCNNAVLGSVTISSDQLLSSLANNTWYHFAAVRSGNSLYLFQNGVQVGTTVTSAGTFSDFATTLNVGTLRTSGTLYPIDGWMDEVRISKGVARWTADFSASLPTAPYGVTSVTFSNLAGDTDEEYRLIGYLVSGNSTAVGNNCYLRPNNDTGSNYGAEFMQGSNTTVSAGTGTDAYGAGGYVTAVGQIDFVEWNIYAKSGNIRTINSKASAGISGTTISAIMEFINTWNNTSSEITSLTVTFAQPDTIGAGSRLLLFKKNTAAGGSWIRESQTYLQPADSYTKLLLHFEGADAATATYDASGAHKPITFVGTAQLDTAQKKFGSSSLLLDGNSDTITLPASADWGFGTGDFTIDLWVRWAGLPASGYTTCFWTQFQDESNKGFFYIYNEAGVGYSVNVAYRIAGNYTVWYKGAIATPSLNTWYHVAVTRSSGTPYLFFNGVPLTLSKSDNASIPNLSATVIIGDDSAGSGYFNGWMDEYRVSKGVARWTSDFSATLPAAPYTGDDPVTSITISGLTGDTTQIYQLTGRIVCGNDNDVAYNLTFNSDTAANYGYQQLYGGGTSVGASRGATTAYNIGSSYDLNYMVQFSELIYAVSGAVRTGLLFANSGIYNTLVSDVFTKGHSWNNSANEITQMVLTAAYAGGIGTGSIIELWKFAPSVALTQSCTESVTTSDIKPKKATSLHAFLSAVTGTDAKPLKGFGALRLASLSISDAKPLKAVGMRPLSDALTLADVYARLWNITHELPESITAADVYSRLWNMLRGYSESVTGTDRRINSRVSRIMVIEGIRASDILQEWLTQRLRTGTWSPTSTGTGPWTLVSPSGNSWMNVGT